MFATESLLDFIVSFVILFIAIAWARRVGRKEGFKQGVASVPKVSTVSTIRVVHAPNSVDVHKVPTDTFNHVINFLCPCNPEIKQDDTVGDGIKLSYIVNHVATTDTRVQ